MVGQPEPQPAYDNRYKLLYNAGARHWNNPSPNPHLSHLLEQLPAKSNCIEFGCGEGHQARLMASNCQVVTAIDSSPTVIEKAMRETPSGLTISYLVGDVTHVESLHLMERSYDLAVDIGCLHMITEDSDRSHYLELVHDLLKPGGKLLLQNGLALDDIQPQSESEAKQLAEEQQLKDKPAGFPVLRKIITAAGEREIVLPLCPCRMLSLDSYIQELLSQRFRILSAKRYRGVNCLYEAIIVAEPL